MPIFNEMRKSKTYVKLIKPFCDRLMAAVLLVLLSPILLLLALTLAVHFSRNPIFIHKRVGKDERIFRLFKFRSMKVDFDEKSISGLGKFIRSISADELPQLMNILMGQMSFVGPRPLLVEYLPYYNKVEKRRHELLPGITGWAQINGRNAISWNKRLGLDIEYVNHVSFILDVKIIARTCWALMRRDMTPYKNKKTIKFSEYASKR